MMAVVLLLYFLLLLGFASLHTCHSYGWRSNKVSSSSSSSATVAAGLSRLPLRSRPQFTTTAAAAASSSSISSTSTISPKEWEVKFIFKGDERVVNVPQDSVLLEAAETIFTDPPFGCRQGACFACTAQVLEGNENIVQDPNNLGPKTLKKGIVCSCQAHVVGPGVVVKLGAYDETAAFEE